MASVDKSVESLRLRRVILFADVVGFTMLMGQDEEAAWRDLRQCISEMNVLAVQYGGEVKQIRGDGLFLLFTDAEKSILFAHSVHAFVEKLNAGRLEHQVFRFRIGINLGDVLVDGDEIAGDSVNIAARIQALAKPGRICVSGRVYDEVRDNTAFAFGYLGKQRMKNVRNTIEVFEVRPEGSETTVAVAARRSTGAGAQETDFLSDQSVVILPFDFLGDDLTDSWLADGLTEDITTNLSKFQQLFVIAKNSANVFQRSGIAPSSAARELRVRYAVNGSVRKAGKKLRVSVELIDAERHKIVWGDQYNRPIEDLLDIQEEISKLIVSATALQIEASERERLASLAPYDIMAYGYVIRGQQHIVRYTRDDNARAKMLYDTALALDSSYARALAAKSRTMNIAWRYAWTNDQSHALDEALALAYAAIDADPRDARGFGELGFAHLYRKEFDESINAYRRALALNPNDADLLSDMGDALAHAGQSDEAVALLERAMKLNPFFPDQYLWHLAGAYYNLYRYEDAVRTILSMQNPTEGRRILAASYAQLGNIAEARRHARLILEAHPEFSVEQWAAVQPDRLPEETARFMEGLRKAGL